MVHLGTDILITGFDSTTGCLTLYFASNKKTITVDLPIANNQYILGDALSAYLNGIDNSHQHGDLNLSTIDNISAILALVVPTPN